MSSLLVYSYFCPSVIHRPGGVQQVVGPLLEVLARRFGWTVAIAHTGVCACPADHEALAVWTTSSDPDWVDPDILCHQAERVRKLASDSDVVLSIDRLLPTSLEQPTVLMCNTLGYGTEASAFTGGRWHTVVAPTKHFAGRLLRVDPQASVVAAPYGLSDDLLRVLLSRSRVEHDGETIVRLPHRPDRRKGHALAIEGLAAAAASGASVKMVISWLDEPRYAAYRTELENVAHTHGVASLVAFESWTAAASRWSAPTEAVVLQLGSFEETFGLAIVESILAGGLAITGSQPAIREIVGGTVQLREVVDPLNWWWHFTEMRAMRSVVAATATLAASLTIESMGKAYDAILSRAASSRSR